MATGMGLLERARKHIGEKYQNIRVPKDAADWRGPWDCAEFVSWLVYQEGGILYGCLNNNAQPAIADAYTGAWKRDSLSIGKRVSVEQAAATPGAFLLRYPPVDGEMGHIVVSDGQGGTVEAKGTLYGVVADKVSGRRWDVGVLVPGIDYTEGSTVPLSAPTKLYAVNQPNMDPAIVEAIQAGLQAAGFSPGNEKGIFGPATMEAVARFQRITGLVADGEVGPATAKALGVQLVGLVPTVLTLVAGTNPLAAVAIALLPALGKLIVNDRSGNLAGSAAEAVAAITGTRDADQARQAVAADPNLAQTLQLRAAAIAAAAASGPAASGTTPIAVPQSATGASPPGGGNGSTPAASPSPPPPPPPVDNSDIRDARASALQFARQGGPLSVGPILVSTIVLIGFFVVLGLLMSPWAGLNSSDPKFQILNIVIGSLTAAFATVVSFWLGSSQGSRLKDAAALTTQITTSDENIERFKEQNKVLQSAQETLRNTTARQTSPQGGTSGVKSASNFDACLTIVLECEGNDTFTNDPADPGGATKYGITLATLKDWRAARADSAPVTVDSVRNLERDEAREIYRSRYWNLLRCDELPVGVDLIVFDFGVNAGPGRSAELLQKAVGAKPDGSIGPLTLGAVKAKDPKAIVETMSDQRLDFYRGLSGWTRFGDGWSNRVDKVRKAALAMLASISG
ncbi:MAG TPA: glycosyl hydrolase 108 family protein [Kaistia sp.]|nr:glycosyl hydrolase 108 family protein [Kaistia sp.]